MLKPGKTFNMSKTSKRVLAQFTDSHARGQWKRMLIDAELSAAIVVKSPKGDGGRRNTAPSGPAGTTGSHAYTTPSVE
jgi:hypothetical protein